MPTFPPRPATRQFSRIRLLLVCPLALTACHTAPGPVVPETRTEKQMIGLLQKFDLWDLNGDQFLDASELNQASQLEDVTASALIDFYDVNGDRKISLREAQKGYKRNDEAEALRAAREGR